MTAVILAVVAFCFFYHPSYLVMRPGPTADVSDDVTLRGTWSEPNPGTYLLTTVSTLRPNVFGLLWAAARGEQIVPLHEVVPPGRTRDAYFAEQQRVFRESRLVAAAAAAQAVGKDVDLDGEGALVQAVVPRSPAEGELRPGDVIVAVDGRAISLAADLQAAIATLPPGTEVALVVERDERRTVLLETAKLGPALPNDGRSGIGVIVSTSAFSIDLSFEVSFESRGIGGPSAGLAYALTIADMLQRRDFATGVVGATGTITPTGSVGPVGGLVHKARALQRAGADLFLVPRIQREELEPADLDVEVHGVARLEEALEMLADGDRGV